MRRPPPSELRGEVANFTEPFSGRRPNGVGNRRTLATLIHQVMSGTGGPAVHPKGRSA